MSFNSSIDVSPSDKNVLQFHKCRNNFNPRNILRNCSLQAVFFHGISKKIFEKIFDHESPVKKKGETIDMVICNTVIFIAMTFSVTLGTISP